MRTPVPGPSCRVLLVERGTRLQRCGRGLFHSGVEEAGPACDLGGFLEAVIRHQPHVAIVDLEGAALEAVAAIESVMAERPLPIVVVSSDGAGRQDAIRALAAGALEIAEFRSAPVLARALHTQVQFLARVQVVKHIKGRHRGKNETASQSRLQVVAIAASLGGPKALARLLKGLPRTFRAPIALCQHITPGFADDLARYLAVETGHDVVEAEAGATLVPGRVLVAPSEAHLVLEAGGAVRLDRGPQVGGFRPSCDVLLKSAATAFGDRAIGVVLTGMGRDGARGLKEIRARGGHTVAQDQQTSVVFGMPGESIALGAAEKVLPLDEIAAQLLQWVGS